MSDTPRMDKVERDHGLAWFGLHDEVGRYLDGMVKFREKAKELERELADANAERERYEQLKAMFDHGGVTIRLIGEVDSLGIPLVIYEYTDWEPLQAAIDAAIAAQ